MPDNIQWDNIDQDIMITRAINYEKAYVIYKVKVTNNLKVPIAKILVKPFISSDLFILDKTSDKIDLLKSGNSRTVTFKLRPQGECGNVEIQGNVSYYDMSEDKEESISIKSIETAVICPMMKRVEIDQSEWDSIVSTLASVQERTKDVPVGKDELFDIVSDILKDLGMYPVVTKSTERRNVGQFYCEGVKGLRYAVKLEAIGGEHKSKLILRTYAESQESLIGCYYKVLDEIETRTDIKRYIDEPMIVQHFQGDYISGGKTEIKDAIVQRSQIGVGSIKEEEEKRVASNLCPECGNVIALENKSLRCKDCKKSFCQTCESWIEKRLEYEGQRIEIRYPLCEDCYEKSYHKQVELINQKITKRKKEERLRTEEERIIRQKEEQERIRLEKDKKKITKRNMIENSIGMILKLIPAGKFLMGSKEESKTQPVHEVKISKPFYIGIYPVTQREWHSVMDSNPSNFNGDTLPVEKVSWIDCQEFIKKLNAKEETSKYRLPTEAEWEYACRAGSTTEYYFGNDEKLLTDYAWFKENSYESTHQVGLKKPNKWGLFDMYGNVFEWCQDNWHDSYEGAPVDGKAWEPGSGKYGPFRVYRGGGWDFAAEWCSSAARCRIIHDYRVAYLGVRLARSL